MTNVRTVAWPAPAEVAKPVALSDLPRHHPGGMVLDRCFREMTRKRDRDVVRAEYKADKYASALAFARSLPEPDPFAVRMFEFGQSGSDEWCFSRGNDLYRAPLADIQTEFDALLVERVLAKAAGCATIVETGCGYGYNLWRLSRSAPDRAYIGGDLAETAAELGSHLFAASKQVRVEVFDYYEPTYDLLAAAEGPVLVYTCHSIEQLPSAKSFVDGLSRHAEKIAGVVQLEPVYEVHDDTLIGCLRRAYADSVDYNRDLLGLLQNRSDIVVHAVEPNVFGINPLNPTTYIHWSFR